MATFLDTLSLSQMLDLAIGMPNNGAVHFAAMRKLLQAVLEHLDAQYLTSQEPWPGQLRGPSLADAVAELKEVKREMEEYKKHMSKVEAHPSPLALPHQPALARFLPQQAEKVKKAEEASDQDVSLSMDLPEDIDFVKTAQTQNTQKIKELAALIKKLEEDMKKLRQDTVKWKEENSKEISQQLEALLEETKRELQKMEEQLEMRKAMLEQLVSETTNKLAEIGEIVESVQEEQERAKAECSNCTFDLKEHLGELLKRCEKLQEQVESLESRQMAMGKRNKMIRKCVQLEHDQERLHCVETTVKQLKEDCEKLSFASGNLQKDSEQKQKEIEMLFQSLEKLQKEKADRLDILAAMDMKADKAALGSKVNCSQFDANLERLDERMQDLQSQISGQEQRWNNTQQQLSLVEEKKLDRQELKTFRYQMEETWKRRAEELRNEMKEGDSGAVIKKQLPVPFTCLSCDRMLSVQVPGQYPDTLPYLQPMPPSKEPPPGQRRPLVRASLPRVPQSSGDHQSHSSTMQKIKASPHTSAQLQRLLVHHNKPSVTLLHGDGRISRGQSDQHLMAIRVQDASGPATSGEHQPGTAPRQVSWAPGLEQPPQPRQTSTAPGQLERTQRRMLDLGHLVRTEKRL
ncbi:unnamed protein product [Coccothraustes coccothraustes]